MSTVLKRIGDVWFGNEISNSVLIMFLFIKLGKVLLIIVNKTSHPYVFSFIIKSEESIIVLEESNLHIYHILSTNISSKSNSKIATVKNGTL